MRILIVTEVFLPAISGVTVSSERLASRLAARGHEVAVLTAALSAKAPSEEVAAGYRVYRVSSYPNPFRPGLRLTAGARREVERVMDRFQPELVHIQDVISLAAQASVVAHRRRIPVVATHHFLIDYVLAYLPRIPGLHQLASSLLVRRLLEVYGRCAALIVPTETVRRALLPGRLLLPVRVISNGVELERFAGSPPKENPPVIVAVGRLDPEKRIEILIAAAALLPADGFRLVIIGSGKCRSALQAQAAELGIAGRVTWIAHLAGVELAQAYCGSDIFCLTSSIETESMVTMEAMAAGLPIVVANGGALPELVQDGENGYLVNGDRPQEWADRLQELLGQPALRTRYGQESRRRINSRDIEASIQQVEDLYAEVLKGQVN